MLVLAWWVGPSRGEILTGPPAAAILPLNQLFCSHVDAYQAATEGREAARQGGPARHVPPHVPLPPSRRSGDPAQAPEQDLLPDLGRRARGGARRRRPGAAPQLRLVLPLLPRSRPMPRAGHDADGDAPFGRRRGRRPELGRSEEHTSELQSRLHLVCRLLLEKKKNKKISVTYET